MKKGISINLTIYDFNVEGLGFGCTYDSLTISTYENGKKTLVGKFCNSRNPPEKPMSLKGNGIELKFVTNMANTYKGFKMGYEWIKAGRWD